MDHDFVSGLVSTHSRLKAAACIPSIWRRQTEVSTHSRLKAAEIVSGDRRYFE